MGGPKIVKKARTARTTARRAPAAKPRGSARREPFVLGSTVVESGSVGYADLRVARLPSGTFASMPVVIVHGVDPGPVIWVSGAVHGDELNGVAVVRQLVSGLDPKALAGTVLGVPIVNVFGVSVGSRYLPDRRDLNRTFPGAPRGSLAGRLAHRFFDDVVRRCEFGIDYHTGSAGRTNWPHLRCRLDDPTELKLAKAYGPPLILDTQVKPGTLRAACHKEGIPVLLCEAGEAWRLDFDAVSEGVTGARRVMAAMHMIDQPVTYGPGPILCESSDWLRAGRSGFAVISVQLGDHVREGEPVATIFDAIGRSEHTVFARWDGVVVGALRQAIVHRGDAILHVGRVRGKAR